MSKYEITFKMQYDLSSQDAREIVLALNRIGDVEMPSGFDFFDLIRCLPVRGAYIQMKASRMISDWLRDTGIEETRWSVEPIDYRGFDSRCVVTFYTQSTAMLFKLTHGGEA